MGQCAFYQIALDQLARMQDAAHLVLVEQGHAHAPIWHRFKRAFRDQPCQRFAHRHGANGHPRSHVCRFEHIARVKAAANQ